MTTSSPRFLTSLPVELLMNITSFLNVDDAINLSQTCKLFRNLVQSEYPGLVNFVQSSRRRKPYGLERPLDSLPADSKDLSLRTNTMSVNVFKRLEIDAMGYISLNPNKNTIYNENLKQKLVAPFFYKKYFSILPEQILHETIVVDDDCAFEVAGNNRNNIWYTRAHSGPLEFCEIYVKGYRYTLEEYKTTLIHGRPPAYTSYGECFRRVDFIVPEHCRELLILHMKSKFNIDLDFNQHNDLGYNSRNCTLEKKLPAAHFILDTSQLFQVDEYFCAKKLDGANFVYPSNCEMYSGRDLNSNKKINKCGYTNLFGFFITLLPEDGQTTINDIYSHLKLTSFSNLIVCCRRPRREHVRTGIKRKHDDDASPVEQRQVFDDASPSFDVAEIEPFYKIHANMFYFFMCKKIFFSNFRPLFRLKRSLFQSVLYNS